MSCLVLSFYNSKTFSKKYLSSIVLYLADGMDECEGWAPLTGLNTPLRLFSPNGGPKSPPCHHLLSVLWFVYFALVWLSWLGSFRCWVLSVVSKRLSRSHPIFAWSGGLVSCLVLALSTIYIILLFLTHEKTYHQTVCVDLPCVSILYVQFIFSTG